MSYEEEFPSYMKKRSSKHYNKCIQWNIDLMNPLYNKVLSTTNDVLHPSNSTMITCTCFWEQTFLTSHLTLRFIKVPLCIIVVLHIRWSVWDSELDL